MATTNFDRYNLVNADSLDNVREDVTDIIYDITPTQTPFLSGIGRGVASNTYTEWPLDNLADVDPNNAVVDGADAGPDQSSPTLRHGNVCQISDKVARISGRAEAVDKIGRRSEMAFQIAKRSKELKRDMEAILTGNQTSAAGDSSTASLLGGLSAWYVTNTNRDPTSGASGGWAANTVTGATDSSAVRAMSETDLRSVIESCYTNGGEPDTIMVTPAMKTVISEYLFSSSARIATLYRDEAGGQGQATAVGAVDVFVSDFGALKIIPNRFQGHNGTVPRHRDVHVCDMALYETRYLRGFQTLPLARTGDAENRQILVDYTLCSKQQEGSGIVADVDSTIPMVYASTGSNGI